MVPLTTLSSARVVVWTKKVCGQRSKVLFVQGGKIWTKTRRGEGLAGSGVDGFGEAGHESVGGSGQTADPRAVAQDATDAHRAEHRAHNE